MANTLYGAAVVLIKNKQIYLSRRTEKVMFPKKWQFINGRLRNMEQSMDTAERLVEEQTKLKIDRRRLYFATNITVSESNEFYYVYILNLNEDEVPLNTCDRWRGDWRIFPLDKASVLDVVPGIRGIIKGLHRSLLKLESDKNFQWLADQKRQQVMMGPMPQQDQIPFEHICQQLSQGEQLHLSKLGPKMTRHYGTHEFDGLGA